MPMTINVGISKKIGLPDFGSVGASCNVQFEADQSLLADDLTAFHQRVKCVFAACRQAVKDELARQQNTELAATVPSNGQAHAESPPEPGPTASPRPQNGSGGNGHPASEKQMTYLRQLAKQVEGLGVRRLETIATKMYGKPLAAISSFEASGLIDTIKSIKAGQIELASALEGEPK